MSEKYVNPEGRVRAGDGNAVSRSAQRRSDLESFAKTWEAAVAVSSLDPKPGRLARDAVERYKALMKAARPSADADENLVAEIVAGKLTPQEAATRSLASTVETAQRLAERAGAQVLGNARAELRGLGDDLIVKFLRPANDKLVAEVEKLAPAVRGIGSDDEALKAGGKTADAWNRLGELSTALAAVHRCVGYDAIPQLDTKHYGEFRFADEPLAVDKIRGHAVRKLVDSLPRQLTINTAHRVGELSRAHDAKLRADAAADKRDASPAAVFA